MASFQVIDLLCTQFHTGKYEDRADQHATNRAQGIEGLGKVQAALGTLRVSQLGDEGVGRSFQE
jgi:hypothetical protein